MADNSFQKCNSREPHEERDGLVFPLKYDTDRARLSCTYFWEVPRRPAMDVKILFTFQEGRPVQNNVEQLSIRIVPNRHGH